MIVPPSPQTDISDPSSTHSRVFAAFQDYLAAAEAGCAPARSEFLAKYPDLVGELSGCLTVLDLVHAASTATPRLSDFKLLREIGRGGMGVVYEAEQISLGRRVAVKVLPAAAALDPRRLRRFRSEAQAAAQTRHPNIVPVFAVGSEEGVYYQVMALIDGVNLAAEIARLRGPAGSPPFTCDRADPERYRTAVRLVVQAAEALDHAHAVGVIHRDVKPANLIVEPSGHLWVVDFGLAKLVGGDDLTHTREMVGTLRYMSPEAAAGEPIDLRADVYGLGVTLYELLTLTPAFPGNDSQEVLRRVIGTDPLLPRRIASDVPHDLETIVLTAMAKAPAERYATPRAMADDLSRFLDHRPLRARRSSTATRVRKWGHRNRTRLLGAFGATMAALVLAVTGLTIVNDRVRTEHAATMDANARLGAALAAQQVAIDRETTAKEAASRARDRERDAAYRYRFAQAWREYEDGNPRQCRAILDACPLEPRGWEWAYLDAICRPSAVRTFPRTATVATSVAISFTPDGRRFAQGPEVWDVTTGSLLLRASVEKKQEVHSSALTPDGRTLILALGAPLLTRLYSNNSRQPRTAECRILDVESGAVVSKFEFSAPAEATAVVTADAQGRRGAVAPGDRTARLFDIATGKWDGEIEADGTIGRVAFHPNGTSVAATVANVGVAVWDVTARTPRQIIRDPTKFLRHVKFSADGQSLLGAAPDRVVRVWDLTGGRERFRFIEHTRLAATATQGNGLAVAPRGGRVASALDDGTVRVWDIETGRQAHIFREHVLGVQALAFAHEGRDLVAVFRDRVAVWEVEPREQLPVRATVARSADVLSPDARRAVRRIADRARIQVVDRATERVVLELPSGPNHHYEFGDDRGRYLFVHDAVAPALPMGSNPAAGGTPFPVTIASLATGGRTTLWDLEAGRQLTEVARPSGRVSWFALAAGGSAYAHAAGAEVAVRATSDGALLTQARTGRQVAAVVAVASTGSRVAYATPDARVTVLDVPTGESRTFLAHAEQPRMMAFRPDGEQLVTVAQDGTARIWDTATGRRLVTFDRHTSAVDAVGWSVDGRRVASGGADRTVRVWDSETGQELLLFTGLARGVHRVAFTADGRQLVARLIDGEHVIWGHP